MARTAPQQALKELGTMYRVHMCDTRKDFKIPKVVTLTKRQEKILKAIDRKLLKEVDDSYTIKTAVKDKEPVLSTGSYSITMTPHHHAYH